MSKKGKSNMQKTQPQPIGDEPLVVQTTEQEQQIDTAVDSEQVQSTSTEETSASTAAAAEEFTDTQSDETSVGTQAPQQETVEVTTAPTTPETVAADSLVMTEDKEIKLSTPKEQLATPVKALEADSFLSRVELLKQKGSIFEKSLINRLENYVTNMAPNRQISEKDGGAMQLTLYKTMINVIEKSGDDFTSCFNIILGFFKQYQKAAFGDLYVNRFMENGSLKGQDALVYQNLVNLIKATCETSTRQATLKQVSLERTLDKGLSEQARQRIIAFYRG